MLRKIFKSPITWASVCILFQVLASKLFPSDGTIFIVSIVLIAFAAIFIWKLEKYEKEMPHNHWSPVFAVVTTAILIVNLWFYAKAAEIMQKIVDNVFMG